MLSSRSRAVDKVLAIPGVDAIAKPAIDALRAKLDALSKAYQGAAELIETSNEHSRAFEGS